MTEESNEKKRYGETVVTSVSLSKEFKEICEQYQISPTEALRKGIAIELFEQGVDQYQTDLNKERAEGIKKWLKAVDNFEKLKQELKEKTKLLSKNIMENI